MSPQGRAGADDGPVATLSFEASVVVPWQGEVPPGRARRSRRWTRRTSSASPRSAPEVVIFGSGARLRFVAPALPRPLLDRRIGVETMDTAAACRTYNVLVSERRSVVAALLL